MSEENINKKSNETSNEKIGEGLEGLNDSPENITNDETTIVDAVDAEIIDTSGKIVEPKGNQANGYNKDNKVCIHNIEEFAAYLGLERKNAVEYILQEDPDAEVLKNRTGTYDKTIWEYINTFMVPEIQVIKKENQLENTKMDFWTEFINIRLFCEWLFNDKKLMLVKYKDLKLPNSIHGGEDNEIHAVR